MELLVLLAAKQQMRSFETQSNGVSKTSKALDVTLTDGLNEFTATAFNEEADKLDALPVPSQILADLRFYNREAVMNDGNKRTFQQVRIIQFATR